MSAVAQESTSPKLLTVTPRVSVTETFTNNALLTGVNPQSEQITEISPGIHIDSAKGRLKGYLDYTLTGVTYAQGSAANRQQQSLNASGTVEAVDGRVFVDVSGVISQQAISAFGTQSVGNTSGNANLSETSSFRVSPYIRGQLGSDATYEARYSLLSSKTASTAASDILTRDWSIKLSGGTSFRRLAWSVSMSRNNAGYSAGRSTESDQLQSSLSYAVSPQFNLTGTSTSESNNYTSLDKQRFQSAGWGANWSPSERTKVAFAQQNRYFGDSHSLSFDHRTERTAWHVGSSRDVSVASDQATTASLGSMYDLFFSQFATLEPDPIKRALLVNAYLQAYGINPNTTVTRGYLTSSISVQRRHDMSFALLGLRDTVTFTATRSEGSRLDSVVAVSDDFAASSVVRQNGLSVSYAHRLTPDTSFNLMLSQQNSSGANSTQDTSLRSLLFNVSTRLGLRTTATMGVRRNTFDSSTSPYGETAFTGYINMQF
jgi:uncharacterized protein (PEP-CTERM system associated)